MIEAKTVTFAYRRGIPVLNDISCTIHDGEAVALLGHNGSGKTTLSRLFMALNHPAAGKSSSMAGILSILNRQTWPTRLATYSRIQTCRSWGYGL